MVAILLMGTAMGAGISGHIHGDSGDPIQDATVYAINPGLQAASTNTDPDGAYNFGTLPSGNYRIWIIPEDGDPHVSRYFPDASSYCEGALLRLESSSVVADMVLPKGTSISGQLLKADGTPHGSVRVRGESETGSPARDCFTDDDGYFNLAGLEKDVLWKLQAAKSGTPVQWWGSTYERSEAVEVDPNQTADIDTWTLLSGIDVTGLVMSPTGPVSDATVRVYSSRQLVQTTTDSSGQYSTGGLPPGDVTAWATAPGLATTYLPDADRPTENISSTEEGDTVEGVDITMPIEATFAILLEGEAPLTNGDLGGLSVMLYNDSRTVGRAGLSDEAGYVEWDGLHGGQYEVLVYGGTAGHPDDWIRTSNGDVRTFEIEPEADHPGASVELPLAITLKGTVEDDDGKPIAGAIVVVTPGSGDDTGHGQEESFFIETTDARGTFSLVGVPEGLWEIRSQVAPNCDTDPGYVTSYWPSEEDPSMASDFEVSLDHPVEDFRFVLARDDDHDQMGDRWERRYDLDTASDDADEDPDKDGLSNLLEFRLRTNPLEPEGYWTVTKSCGCSSGPASGALPWLPLIVLGFRRRRA